MKTAIKLSMLALLLAASSASFAWWGGNNNGWGNSWPEWTPMYWMDEFTGDNDYYGGPWGGGGYPYGGYGGNPYGGGYAPYGYNNYPVPMPTPYGYGAPVAPAAQ